MTRLCLVVFSLFLIQGCAIRQVQQSAGTPVDQPVSIFKTDSLYSFQTVIQAYGRTISGILYVKKDSSQVYKIVFANESGFQLMALEFEKGKMRSHKVFKKLDKKIVLNTLARGMKLLFYETLCPQFYQRNAGVVQAECLNNGTAYRIRSNEKNYAVQIDGFEKDKRKVFATFEKYQSDFPEHIQIGYDNLQLSYELKVLKK